MDVTLILKVAGVGILVAACHQILSRAGREDQAMLVSVAGTVIVLVLLAEKIGELRAILGGKQISNHELLAENVFQTTYEGGVIVITNYTAQPYESASGVVEAGHYLLIQEGGAL